MWHKEFSRYREWLVLWRREVVPVWGTDYNSVRLESLFPCIYFCVSIHLCTHPASLCTFILPLHTHLCTYAYIHAPIHLPMHISIHAPMHNPCTHTLIHIPIHPSTHVSIHTPFCYSCAYPSRHPCTHPCTHLSIYAPNRHSLTTYSMTDTSVFCHLISHTTADHFLL